MALSIKYYRYWKAKGKTAFSLFHFTAYTRIFFQHSFLSGLISVIRKAVNRWTMCRRQQCNVYCWSWRQEEMCALKMANRQILGTATFNNGLFSCQTRVTTWLFENLKPNDLNVLQSNLQDHKHVKYAWIVYCVITNRERHLPLQKPQEIDHEFPSVMEQIFFVSKGRKINPIFRLYKK